MPVLKTQRWVRVLILVLALALPLGGLVADLTPSPAYATEVDLPGDHDKDEDKDKDKDKDKEKDEEPASNQKDISFYHIASIAASYYSDTHAGLGEGSSGAEASDAYQDLAVKIGNAGGLVGYNDKDHGKGSIVGNLVSQVSQASQSRSYESLWEESGGNQGIFAYAMYGKALKDLGLDSTSLGTGAGLGAVRAVAGVLLGIAYMMAVSAEMLFIVVLKILQLLNPFAWFKHAVQGPLSPYLAAAPDVPAFNKVAAIVSNFYGWFQTISIAFIIPMMLALLATGLLLFRKNGDGAGKTKRFFIRLAFIFLGIPLLGNFYTTAIDGLVNGSQYGDGDIGASSASRIVTSTLVDFESWANNTRLAMPRNSQITINLDHPRNIDYSKTTDVRHMAHSINTISQNETGSSGGTSKGYWYDGIESGESGGSTASRVTAIFDLIGRYMRGDQYYAAVVETNAKGRVPSSQRDNYFKMLEADTKVATYKKDPGSFIQGTYGENNLSLNQDYKVNSVSQGLFASSVSNPNSGFIGFGGQGNIGNPGLSELSLYNFLNTEFTDTSVVVYSPEKSTSNITRKNHAAVNLVGTGILQVLYFLHAFALLIALGILGWGYAFAILINQLKRGISLVVATPAVLMGSIKAGVRIVTYVLVMVVEVIVTIFLYTLSANVLLGLGSIIGPAVDQSLPQVFSTVLPGGATLEIASSLPMMVVKLLIAIVATLWFAKMAMKLRGAIVGAVSEALSGIVDRLFGTGNYAQQAAAKDTMRKPNALATQAGNTAKAAAGGLAAGTVAGKALDKLQEKELADRAAEAEKNKKDKDEDLSSSRYKEKDGKEGQEGGFKEDLRKDQTALDEKTKDPDLKADLSTHDRKDQDQADKGKDIMEGDSLEDQKALALDTNKDGIKADQEMADKDTSDVKDIATDQDKQRVHAEDEAVKEVDSLDQDKQYGDIKQKVADDEAGELKAKNEKADDLKDLAVADKAKLDKNADDKAKSEEKNSNKTLEKDKAKKLAAMDASSDRKEGPNSKGLEDNKSSLKKPSSESEKDGLRQKGLATSDKTRGLTETNKSSLDKAGQRQMTGTGKSEGLKGPQANRSLAKNNQTGLKDRNIGAMSGSNQTGRVQTGPVQNSLIQGQTQNKVIDKSSYKKQLVNKTRSSQSGSQMSKRPKPEDFASGSKDKSISRQVKTLNNNKKKSLGAGKSRDDIDFLD